MIKELRREFTINMGNYESVKIGGYVQDDSGVMTAADLDRALKEMLHDDLVRAANISDVKNTFILTWLEEDSLKGKEGTDA